MTELTRPLPGDLERLDHDAKRELLAATAEGEIQEDESQQEQDEASDAHEPRSRDGPRPPGLDSRQRGDRGDEHRQAEPEHPTHGAMISLPGAARGRNGVAIPCDIVAA